MKTRESIKNKLNDYFKPGAPITNKKLLFGREQEIHDLQNILERQGQHAIVIGDRGVGKTSLVKSVLSEGERKLWHSRGCEPFSTYDKLMRDCLKDAGFIILEEEITKTNKNSGEAKIDAKIVGSTLTTENETSHKYIIKSNDLQPFDIFSALKQLGEKHIFILDEYDAVHGRVDEDKFNSQIAYTIKTMSDGEEECKSKIIIVGVARSSEELIGKHESVQRNLREVFLRPIKRQHIYEFFELIEEQLEITFNESIKKHITEESLGYPYFFHLVGLECVEAMLNRDNPDFVVNNEDYKYGYKRATDMAFRAELSKYRKIFFPDDKTINQIDRIILTLLATSLNYPPKREELKEKFVRTTIIPNDLKKTFDESLLKLIQVHKVIHISRHTDELRFFDPLLRPFIVKYYKLNYDNFFKNINPKPIIETSQQTLFDF